MATELNEQFIRQIQELLPKEARQLADALRQEPATSIRLNRRKSSGQADGAAVPWCGCGYYMGSRPAFTFDPLLHAGVYYVQDASSMFVHYLVRQLAGSRDVTYLDLCAAPGGKTTAAIDALTDGSLVVCNEIDRTRVQVLRENVTKWGCRNSVVTNDTPRSIGRLHHFFDIIAADMPCSGEGMFRKDEEAVAQWSPSLVAQCACRQQEIARDVWDALKPGGFFIYSTCTFNREENERMAEFIAEELGAEPVALSVDERWNIHPAIGSECPGYRFMPHRTRGEGLFVAVLRKPEVAEKPVPEKKQQKQKPQKQLSAAAEVRKMLSDSERYDLESDGDTVCAIPAAHAKAIRQIVRTVRTVQRGIPLATVKGKDLVPQQAAALCPELAPTAFPVAELDYTEAIAYLRGESFPLTGTLPRGYVLAAYRGHPLGFMKNLGNRANNCYPKEWRIRSTHFPQEAPETVKE